MSFLNKIMSMLSKKKEAEVNAAKQKEQAELDKLNAEKLELVKEAIEAKLTTVNNFIKEYISAYELSEKEQTFNHLSDAAIVKMFNYWMDKNEFSSLDPELSAKYLKKFGFKYADFLVSSCTLVTNEGGLKVYKFK